MQFPSFHLFALSGCSTSKFGRLEWDKEVKRSFESYQVLPNHKYYYWGVSSSPIAIVGIEETYELNLTMYTQIDTESDDYRRLIDNVSLRAWAIPSNHGASEFWTRRAIMWESGTPQFERRQSI